MPRDEVRQLGKITENIYSTSLFTFPPRTFSAGAYVCVK